MNTQKAVRNSSPKGLSTTLIYMTVVTSMLIPRSGTDIAGVPVTLPNLLYMAVILLWAAQPARMTFSLRRENSFEGLAIYGVAVYLLLGILSVLHGMAKSSSMTDLAVEFIAFLGFVPMFYLVRQCVRDTDTLNTMAKTVVGALAAVSLYGVCQKLFGHYTTMVPGITLSYSDAQVQNVFMEKNNWTPVGLKVVSTFQNGNLFGNFLVLTMPLLVSMTAISKDKTRVKYMVFLVIVVSSLILTLSRGAIVAGVASLVLLAWYLRPLKFPAMLAAVFFVVGGALVFMLGLSDRLLAVDFTMAGRTEMWTQLFYAYDDMPVLPWALSVLFGAGMGGSIGYWNNALQLTESSLLNIFIKMGGVGITAFLFSVLGTFIFATSVRRFGLSREGAISIGLAVGLVAATIQFAIDSVMLMPPTSMNFWIIAGLAAAAGKIIRQQQRHANTTDGSC